MVTYKERKENTKHYVLLEGDTVLGVFGNLKKVCEFMGGKDFPSYSTLTKKGLDRVDHKEYSLQRVKFF